MPASRARPFITSAAKSPGLGWGRTTASVAARVRVHFFHLSRRHSANRNTSNGAGVVVTYVGVTGHRRCDREAALAAAGGESQADSGCQGKTEQEQKGLEQPIAADAGKWELGALCVFFFATVLSGREGGNAHTRLSIEWDGDSDGGGQSLSPSGPVGQGRARGGAGVRSVGFPRGRRRGRRA